MQIFFSQCFEPSIGHMIYSSDWLNPNGHAMVPIKPKKKVQKNPPKKIPNNQKEKTRGGLWLKPAVDTLEHQDYV